MRVIIPEPLVIIRYLKALLMNEEVGGVLTVEKRISFR
jgi:hypothetical protein